jgi:hypothetical protein
VPGVDLNPDTPSLFGFGAQNRDEPAMASSRLELPTGNRTEAAQPMNGIDALLQGPLVGESNVHPFFTIEPLPTDKRLVNCYLDELSDRQQNRRTTWADAYNDVHCSGSPVNGRQDTRWGLHLALMISAASGSQHRRFGGGRAS